MERAKRIPNQLKRYRKLMGYTLKDVACMIDIKNRGRISAWERGYSLPSLEHLLKLSILYKTLVHELYPETFREFHLKLKEKIAAHFLRSK